MKYLNRIVAIPFVAALGLVACGKQSSAGCDCATTTGGDNQVLSGEWLGLPPQDSLDDDKVMNLRVTEDGGMELCEVADYSWDTLAHSWTPPASGNAACRYMPWATSWWLDGDVLWVVRDDDGVPDTIRIYTPTRNSDTLVMSQAYLFDGPSSTLEGTWVEVGGGSITLKPDSTCDWGMGEQADSCVWGLGSAPSMVRIEASGTEIISASQSSSWSTTIAGYWTIAEGRLVIEDDYPERMTFVRRR